MDFLRKKKIKWDDSWNQNHSAGIFRKGFVDGNLMVGNDEYEAIKEGYLKYTQSDNLAIDDSELDMLNAVASRGLFSCLSSASPYPCQLDNQCSKFGFKTRDMAYAKPPQIGILAAGNLNTLNSTISGEGVEVSGMKYEPPTNSSDLFVGLPGGGMSLPKTNSEQLKIISISIIVVAVIIVLICIIGTSVVTGGGLSNLKKKINNDNKIIFEFDEYTDL